VQHVIAVVSVWRSVDLPGDPGSSVADIEYRRLGSVGPSTEQKYWSQIVKLSASA